MKLLLNLTFAILLLPSLASPATQQIETTVSPKPPYPPGTKVVITISGPGIASLDSHGYYILVGKGTSDFMQNGQVRTSGRPPKFEFTIVAPEWANTTKPRLEFSITAKNGAREKLNVTNTPAFAQLAFSGIKLDTNTPVAENFKFSQPSVGVAVLEFDVREATSIDYLGGTIWLSGSPYNSGNGNFSCQGKAPLFKCKTRVSFPPKAQGSIQFEFGIGDLAGNRLDVKQIFQLAKIADVDTSTAQIKWPINAAICSDATIRFNFEVTGGAGVHDGAINVWAKSERLGSNSTEGIASQATFECADGKKCETIFSFPRLIGIENGSLSASAGGNRSDVNVGGRTISSEIKFEIDGNNSSRYTKIFPAATLTALMSAAPTKGKACNKVFLTEKGNVAQKSEEAADSSSAIPGEPVKTEVNKRR